MNSTITSTITKTDLLPFVFGPVIVSVKGSFIPLRGYLTPDLRVNNIRLDPKTINSIQFDEDRLAIDVIEFMETTRETTRESSRI